MAHTRTWEETYPAGTEAASLGDDRIRNLKTDLGERLEDMLYGFNAASGTDNEALYGVKKLRFRELSADPTIIDTGNEAFLYTKNVSNVSELFLKNNADQVRQISNAGRLNVIAGDYAADSIDQDDIRLANNSFLTARNNAGDGDVNLIAAGTSDVPLLAADVTVQTSHSVNADYKVATKKYTDDQCDAHIAGTGLLHTPGTEQVFNGTLTAALTFQDLTLSGATAIGAANQALCFFEVTSNKATTFAMKPKGYGSTYGNHLNADGHDMGGASCHLKTAGDYAYLTCITDTSGVVQIGASDNTATITIKLIGFIE